jgi:hypothetical protein
LFGTATGAITLYNIEFAFCGIRFSTVSEFTWEGKTVENAFADNAVSGGSGGKAGFSSKKSFLNDSTSILWVFFEVNL